MRVAKPSMREPTFQPGSGQRGSPTLLAQDLPGARVCSHALLLALRSRPTSSSRVGSTTGFRLRPDFLASSGSAPSCSPVPEGERNEEGARLLSVAALSLPAGSLGTPQRRWRDSSTSSSALASGSRSLGKLCWVHLLCRLALRTVAPRGGLGGLLQSGQSPVSKDLWPVASGTRRYERPRTLTAGSPHPPLISASLRLSRSTGLRQQGCSSPGIIGRQEGTLETRGFFPSESTLFSQKSIQGGGVQGSPRNPQHIFPPNPRDLPLPTRKLSLGFFRAAGGQKSWVRPTPTSFLDQRGGLRLGLVQYTAKALRGSKACPTRIQGARCGRTDCPGLGSKGPGPPGDQQRAALSPPTSTPRVPRSGHTSFSPNRVRHGGVEVVGHAAPSDFDGSLF